MRRGEGLAWVGVLAALAVMYAAMILARGAPVPGKPKSKPKPKSAHVGSWRMHWGQGQGDVIFNRDGGYWCLWAGQQWIGSWKLEGGRLYVTEGKVPDRPDAVPEQPVRWWVELGPTGVAGDCVHEGRRFSFKLTGGAVEEAKASQPD